MRELGADYGIHGEGEGPLAELIGALERGETGADIPAVYTRDGRTGNGPMGNGPAENRLSENTPTGNERTGNGRRSYLPAIEVEFEPELTGYYWKRSGMLNIQTKRGAPTSASTVRILISTGGACARWTPKSSPKTSFAPSAITA